VGRAARPRREPLVLLFAGLFACGGEADLECHFGDGELVARSGGRRYDQVRLVPREDRGVALWSADDGTWARPLGGDARRLGLRCDGGLDAWHEPLVVACATRPRPALDQPARVTLWRLDDSLEITARRTFEAGGRDSRGLVLAPDGDGWRVVWHSGRPGAWEVWSVRAGFDEAPLEPRLLSDPSVAAGPPALASSDGDLWLTWAETWLDAGYPAGRVVVWRGAGAPQEVATVDHDDPSPTLILDDDTRVLLFRDFRRPYRRPSLFAQRLDERGAPVGRARRVARANARGRPRGLRCAERVVTVTPRSWDQDVLVGVNVLDEELGKLVREQQVYEWSAHFDVADAACVDGAVQLLVGARADSAEATTTLHAMALRCE